MPAPSTEKIHLKDFDASKYFDTIESQLDLINEALASGDRGFLLDALGTVAKAQDRAIEPA